MTNTNETLEQRAKYLVSEVQKIEEVRRTKESNTGRSISSFSSPSDTCIDIAHCLADGYYYLEDPSNRDYGRANHQGYVDIAFMDNLLDSCFELATNFFNVKTSFKPKSPEYVRAKCAIEEVVLRGALERINTQELESSLTKLRNKYGAREQK